jgi:hypothetical protein
MSEDAADWQSDIFGILPHPAEPRILMLRDREGWSLPHARLERGIWLHNLGVVSDELSRVFGVEVRAYRYVHYERDEEQHREEGIYLLEWVSQPETSPPGGQWLDRQGVAALALSHPEQRAVLDDYFREIADGVVPERRQPWARSGWFDEAAAWITARLAERGEAVIAPIEQVRNWSLSCVLRARTTTGSAYFKVASELPLFVNEPVVVDALSRLYPEHIPAPLAIDAGRRWMLLADFGEPLGSDTPLDAREMLLCAYGKVQVATANQAEQLLALGCIDRRLDRLVTQIDPLLADLDAQLGLDAGEIARLHALAPRLKAFCVELAAYRIPPTLVHGDLHGGNTAIRGGKPIFFDWTDACLSHPFFDLMSLLYQEEAVEMRLRDAYLALWTDYEPPERLLAAWALARPLSAVHQAVSYQSILAAQEARTRREHVGDAGIWLRRVLQAMPA